MESRITHVMKKPLMFFLCLKEEGPEFVLSAVQAIGESYTTIVH